MGSHVTSLKMCDEKNQRFGMRTRAQFPLQYTVHQQFECVENNHLTEFQFGVSHDFTQPRKNNDELMFIHNERM